MDRAQAIISAKQQLKEAYKVLRQVQANARQIRDSFLIDCAKHLAQTRQLTKAQAIQQLLQAELQAVTFRKLCHWLKDNEYHQLTRILTPDNPQDLNTTTWTSITNADDLHDILTKEGQTHYGQATTSPLVSGPIGAKIGPFDDNTYGDDILNGTFDLSDINDMQEVKDIIYGMHYPDPNNPTPTFDTTIEHDQFYQAIYHTRE